MSEAQTDIAIIGMSCLLPGAPDVDAYWQNILGSVNCIREAPDEWAVPYYDPSVPLNTQLERIYTRKVGLLGDLAVFDPVEFGVVPNAIPATEPDHFLALREAARALRDAGYADKAFDRTRTGVILGRGATPNPSSANGFQAGLVLDQTMDLLQQLAPELGEAALARIRKELYKGVRPFTPEAAPGLVSNVAVGRIANRLDLMGPSYMVDAACASSLIAVDQAMQELRSGRCDMMLAGGVQATMPPQVYMMFCQLNALSRTTLRPFDAAADGTLLGEGCGFLVLKRLADARRDGDRVYAVLKGVGLASDGRALGLLAPRLEGERLAMQRAYEQTGLAPADVGLLEAHGTGIPLGDQTEVAAIGQVFGPRVGDLPRCAMGSVKSMIGHCIPASGIASLIKTSLALYHRVLPPTLCGQVSDKLGLERTPLYINTRTRPWIHGGEAAPRRAAVNAFGFGGINAHALLEEAAGGEAAPRDHTAAWPAELYLFSGADRAALQAQAGGLLDTVRRLPQLPAAALARALAAVPAGPCRLAVVASGLADLADKLPRALAKIADPACDRWQTRSGIAFRAAPEPAGRTALLFPGHGSQYPDMLSDLCLHLPAARAWFDQSDAAFEGRWPVRPSEYVFAPPTGVAEAVRERLGRDYYAIDVATETMFTACMALYQLLTDCGLGGDALVGHSTGEYTALVAGGIIDVPDAEALRQLKRKMNRMYVELNTAQAMPRGSLLTVGAVEPDALAGLLAAAGGRLHVTVDNCPHQKIVFGQKADIDALAAQVTRLGGIAQELPFGTASHTPLFEPMLDALRTYYAALPIVPPRQRTYSCSTGEAFPDDPEAIRRVASHQWFSPVRFRETIEHLYAEGYRTFIEVGPNNVLTSFVADILRGQEHTALATNERSRPALEQFLRVLGQQFARGAALRAGALFAHRRLPELDLARPEAILAKPRRTQRPLDLHMPRLTLGADFVREVRAGRTDAAAAPAADAHAAQASVLSGHFALMSEFIASQQRCAETLFRTPPPEPAPPPPPR